MIRLRALVIVVILCFSQEAFSNFEIKDSKPK